MAAAQGPQIARTRSAHTLPTKSPHKKTEPVPVGLMQRFMSGLCVKYLCIFGLTNGSKSGLTDGSNCGLTGGSKRYLKNSYK